MGSQEMSAQWGPSLHVEAGRLVCSPKSASLGGGGYLTSHCSHATDLGQEGSSISFNASERSMAPSLSLVPHGPDANELQKTLLMAQRRAREINTEKSV